MNQPMKQTTRNPDRRIAALDVGSNSFHLVVVSVADDGTEDGSWTVIERAKEMVRLGASTLKDGVIPEASFHRGLAALRGLAQIAQRHAPEALIATATSAVREASNGPAFVAAAAACGVALRIIEGVEEARLIFAGARRSLALTRRRVALVDLGGGSTEIIVGDATGPQLTDSLKVGVLRLRDLFPLSEPPRPAERSALEAHVAGLIRPVLARARALGFDELALSSGSAQALAKLAGSPAALTLGALRALEAELASRSIAERGALPAVEARRADTILHGAIILRVVLEEAGVSRARICETALREGLVADYLARHPSAPLASLAAPLQALR
jgi:exopolyphosphatase/guanosine-5'-triphosphate,3'-diphosphate pyrophosphatase